MSSKAHNLTLSDIRKITKISMPSLIKYKNTEAGTNGRLYPFARGEGRGMKFTKGAVKVFRRLRQEGLAKRGRPRKSVKVKSAKTGGN